MGFNYGYEKKKFDSRWKRLEVEYCDAGMSEEQIAAMKEYDWAWFCSQRVFQNHTQPIPCEQYDEVCGQSQLFRKFASLSYQWDVDKIDQTRYGWLASVENEQLLLRLKKQFLMLLKLDSLPKKKQKQLVSVINKTKLQLYSRGFSHAYEANAQIFSKRHCLIFLILSQYC